MFYTMFFVLHNISAASNMFYTMCFVLTAQHLGSKRHFLHDVLRSAQHLGSKQHVLHDVLRSDCTTSRQQATCSTRCASFRLHNISAVSNMFYTMCFVLHNSSAASNMFYTMCFVQTAQQLGSKRHVLHDVLRSDCTTSRQ